MTRLFFVLLTFVMGVATSAQLAMLGALGEDFGVVEGAWISITLTVGGGALLLAARGRGGSAPPRLAAPLNAPWPHLAVGIVTFVGYGLSLKGVPAELTLPGLLGLVAMIATSWIIPRTGAAVFLVATSAGLLLGGVVLDHFAWLGAAEQRIDVARSAGVVLLLAGVVLVSHGQATEAAPEPAGLADPRDAVDALAPADSPGGD